MKKQLLILMLLTLGFVKAQTIKIGSLEIMKKDLGTMNYSDARKACKELGNGWRLPSKEELNLLYKNKNKIGGFSENYYWSASEAILNNKWVQDFYNGNQINNKNENLSNVRAVRNF